MIFAGAILGITAALLWSAQGSIMMSYPLEKDKGKAFAVFWAIFQLGAFIGAIIALAINIRSGGLSAVSTSTYIVSYRLLRQKIYSSAMFVFRRFWSSSSSVLPLPSSSYHQTMSFVETVRS